MTKSEMAEAAERMFRLVEMDDDSAALIRKAVVEKEELYAKQLTGMAELTALNEELGLYDDEPNRPAMTKSEMDIIRDLERTS